MPIDYTFFEASLAEQRTYRGGWDRAQLDLLKAPHIRSRVKVLSRRRDDFRFRGTHVMNPGYPLGLARVNEQFNITLPDDIDAFYRRWNGGFLLFRRFYQMLNADEIIEHNIEMRQIRQEPMAPELPWHLVRFCYLGDGEYLALMLKSTIRTWNVIWASHEELDATYIAELSNAPPVDGPVLGPTFYDWLKRMCDSDGWPMTAVDEGEPAPADRIV